MRIRSIKPAFFTHDDLAALPPLARLLFIALWCIADSKGRLEDKPRRIKAEALPYDDCDIDELLGLLHSHAFIIRYEVNGGKYIEIPAFTRHQRITGKEAETPSRFPELHSIADDGCTGDQSGNNGETTGKHPVSLEGKGREGSGKEGKDSSPLLPNTFIPPTLEQWLERLPGNGADEWAVSWWTGKYAYIAGVGWKTNTGQSLVNWQAYQDGKATYFRNDMAERAEKAKKSQTPSADAIAALERANEEQAQRERAEFLESLKGGRQ